MNLHEYAQMRVNDKIWSHDLKFKKALFLFEMSGITLHVHTHVTTV